MFPLLLSLSLSLRLIFFWFRCVYILNIYLIFRIEKIDRKVLHVLIVFTKTRSYGNGGVRREEALVAPQQEGLSSSFSLTILLQSDLLSRKFSRNPESMILSSALFLFIRIRNRSDRIYPFFFSFRSWIST